MHALACLARARVEVGAVAWQKMLHLIKPKCVFLHRRFAALKMPLSSAILAYAIKKMEMEKKTHYYSVVHLYLWCLPQLNEATEKASLSLKSLPALCRVDHAVRQFSCQRQHKFADVLPTGGKQVT